MAAMAPLSFLGIKPPLIPVEKRRMASATPDSSQYKRAWVRPILPALQWLAMGFLTVFHCALYIVSGVVFFIALWACSVLFIPFQLYKFVAVPCVTAALSFAGILTGSQLSNHENAEVDKRTRSSSSPRAVPNAQSWDWQSLLTLTDWLTKPAEISKRWSEPIPHPTPESRVPRLNNVPQGGGLARREPVSVAPSRTESQIWKTLLQKCSICFDAPLDICLHACGDQFCKSCFQTYVSIKVRDSWGLNVSDIKCPVCSVTLALEEWSQYVDSSTLELYHRYNQPFKALVRQCSTCSTDITVASQPSPTPCTRFEAKQVFENVLVELGNHLESDDPVYRNLWDTYEVLRQQVATLGNIFWPNCPINTIVSKTVGAFYQLYDVKCCPTSPTAGDQSQEISTTIAFIHRATLQLTSMISDPEEWKTLQFRIIQQCPALYCSHCHHEYCFQCGENSHHRGLDCLQYISQQLAEPATAQSTLLPRDSHSPHRLETLRWIAINSKRCPRCCILINRDEGCHKVHCLFCDYEFCWVCMQSWSQACGFFVCQNEKQGGSRSPPSRSVFAVGISNEDGPEDGVPDVTAIEARLHRDH
ncbi:hypothetical protein IWQ62_000520 [Dispira parvispora]|uniref:RBR-type E3 ubiquitin transferase n=1 Tax=Dispira parvispora TaxID=1520584 RepID=A0A9W8EA26_9FUNG|nr:hypothetical protein IWQ62_000520 [Dispira parvispora]